MNPQSVQNNQNKSGDNAFVVYDQKQKKADGRKRKRSVSLGERPFSSSKSKDLRTL